MEVIKAPVFRPGQKVRARYFNGGFTNVTLDPDEDLTIDEVGFYYTIKENACDIAEFALCPGEGSSESDQARYCLGELTDQEVQMLLAFRASSQEARDAFEYLVQRMGELEGIRSIVAKKLREP